MASTPFVVFMFIGLIISGTGNKVLGKFVTIPYQNYPYYLVQLVTFFFIPSSFGWVGCVMLWKKFVSKEDPSTYITPAMRAIPQKVWAVMGALDGFAMLLGVFSNTFISNGATLTLMAQFAIPVAMLLSWWFLGQTFTTIHYVAVTLVNVSIGIVMIPSFLNTSSVDYSQLPPTTDAWYWYVVSLAQWIPATFSYIYKERTLKDVDVDPMYLNGWVAVYQFLFGVIVCVPAGYAVGVLPADLPDNIAWGFKCMLGHNTQDSDNCVMTGPVFTSTFLIDVVLYNLFVILLIKYGSATWMLLAQTLLVPLGSFAFAIPYPEEYVPASNRATIDGWLLGGMAGLLIGLFLYNEMHRMLCSQWFPAPGSPMEGEDGTGVASGVDETSELMGGVPKEKRRHHIAFSQPGLGGMIYGMEEIHHIVVPETVVRKSASDIRRRYLTQVTGHVPPSPTNSSSMPIVIGGGDGDGFGAGGNKYLATSPGFRYSTSVGIDGKPKSPSKYFRALDAPVN